MTDFLAGSIGGAAGVFVGHPFDTVKVRLQTQCQKGRQYTGVVNCFVNIVKHESLSGLYKGLASPLVGMSFQNAIIFGVHKGMMKMSGKEGLRNEFLIGCTSGAIQTVIATPIELAKTQLQLQGKGERQIKSEKMYQGPSSFLRKTYKAEGLQGLFRGYWLTFLRDTPAFGAYFFTYLYICQKFTPPDKSINNLGPFPLMLAGGTAGIASWVVTYPIDVVKSRLQAETTRINCRYSTMLECTRKCYAEGGYRVFFAGISATMVRAFPVNAATLATVSLITRGMQ